MRISFLHAAALLLVPAACGAAAQVNKSPTDATAATIACTDVGLSLRIRRTAAMPLEELSELHTGKSCATTTVMAMIADDAATALEQAALDVVDCVTTRIDEELLGLFAVLRVCNRPHGAAPMTLTAWDAHIRPKLQHAFVATSGRTDGLQYHRSHVECETVAMPTSYTRRVSATAADDSDDVPRFRYKSTELWSVRGTSNKPETSLVLLKLTVKNDGSAPLHVFAAAVKMVDQVPPSHGVLVLTPQKVEPIMPSSEGSILFQLEMPTHIEFPDEADCLVYFAHTSSRAHILEGRLDGKKLKITGDTKKKKSLARQQADLLSVHKIDGSNTLEAAYAAFPFGVWQLASIGIVVVVGLTTTVYMRRKWTGVHWSPCLDCWSVKKLKHKSSSLPKTTEMTSRHPPGYDPDGSSDGDMDALESDGFLSTESMGAGLPPRKKAMAKLREKMPAITMQWKKPDMFRNKLSSVRRALQLDVSARLDAQRFESLWEQFIQRHNVSFHATKRPTVEMVVQSMATVGIMCMASGTVNGVEKYVLYAKQSDSKEEYFFVAVDILVASNETNLSIRTSKGTNDALVEQFVILVDEQLNGLFK